MTTPQNQERIGDGGQVFPCPTDEAVSGAMTPGMSLRDHFAGQALSGICALRDDRVWKRLPEGETEEQWRTRMFTTDAEYAYRFADAMLRVRKEPK